MPRTGSSIPSGPSQAFARPMENGSVRSAARPTLRAPRPRSSVLVDVQSSIHSVGDTGRMSCLGRVKTAERCFAPGPEVRGGSAPVRVSTRVSVVLRLATGGAVDTSRLMVTSWSRLQDIHRLEVTATTCRSTALSWNKCLAASSRRAKRCITSTVTGRIIARRTSRCGRAGTGTGSCIGALIAGRPTSFLSRSHKRQAVA